MMKKTRWIAALALALMLAFGATAMGEAAGADLYFENGVIYTVDANDSVAQALAVKDGRIVFVGSAEEGAAFREGAAEVVDLEGNMLMPGLTDSHIHSVTPDFFDFNLLGATTLEETLAAIAKAVAESPELEAYLGFGYMTNIFSGLEAEKGPRKERLDEICADKPLAIASFDGHALWANSAYLEKYHITGETQSPRGGILEKDEETGEVWGTLKDAAIALGEVEYNPDKLMPGLRDYQAMLNAYGYTSIMTVPGFGVMPIPFDAYRQLEDEGALTIKVHGATSVMDFSREKDIERMIEAKEKYNSPMVKMNTAKFFMDGVVDAHTAYLLAPYNDAPDSTGMASWEPEMLAETYARVNEAGVQIHAHAIGDAALRMSLDAMEYARDNVPAGDYRNAITHLQIVDEADIPRMGELDVIAVAQPYWHYRQPDYWDVVEYAAVGERAEREYPMKSFQDAGAVIAASSDFPVSTKPQPFLAMQVGVTRNLVGGLPEVMDLGLERLTDMDDPTYLLAPEERVTIQDMIRSFTAGGAYLTFSEEEKGTLEVGKAADMIILNQNLLEISPLQIEDTVVLRTYVDGRLVYEADL